MGKKELQKFSESRNSTVLWIDYLCDVDHNYDDCKIKYHYHDNNDDNIIIVIMTRIIIVEQLREGSSCKKVLQAPTAQLG